MAKPQDPIEQRVDPFLPEDEDVPELAPLESSDEDVGEGPESDESKAEKKLENDTLLAALGQQLQGKFRKNEKDRVPIEDRWLEDLRQYHGKYDPEVDAALREAESCALFLNVTKPKTHAYSARVMDMVLPTDGKNFGLDATPVPEVAGAAAAAATSEKPAMETAPDGTQTPMQTPEGAPVQEKDIIKGIKDEADARAELMEDEIDDQLTEAKYNAIQRECIEQMAKLGTGIIMGPVITDEWRVTWKVTSMPTPDDPKHEEYVRTLVPNTDRRPGAQWIDCWNFYPDMTSNRPDGLEHAFVQYLVNPSELRKMAKRFNFMEEPLKKVLAGGAPFNINALRWMTELRTLSEVNTFVDERFRLLRYYGEINEDDLRAVGMDPDKMGIENTISGSIWLIDGTVLKIDLNPLDSGCLPFSIAYCDKDESSIFGTGIPRLMRGEQESVNATWRMKHDNAGLSVGPQTVVKMNSVQPADGDWNMKPKKLWYAADDVQDVSRIFAHFAIDSHQEELDNLLQQAIRFADDVTQLPLLMQGDQAPHITQTAQGMSLLYNASTVVLRRTVKFYDDYVTEPMVNRFYEWNMQFNPRSDIKGDFRAVARGSSTLLDKEQQGQALDAAMQLAMQPTWQPYFDMKKLAREAMKGKRIGDVMNDDDTIAKNLKEQQDAAAAAQQAGAAGPAAPPPDPLGQAKIDAMNKATDARVHDTDTRLQIATANLASKEGISTEQAAARIAGVKIKESAANQRFNAEIDLKHKQGTGI